jgi:hypothetical protein
VLNIVHKKKKKFISALFVFYWLQVIFFAKNILSDYNISNWSLLELTGRCRKCRLSLVLMVITHIHERSSFSVITVQGTMQTVFTQFFKQAADIVTSPVHIASLDLVDVA